MSSDQTTARTRLARLALDTAIVHPDVTGSSAGRGGTCVTICGQARLEGVSAVVEPGGSCAVRLCLTARMVPLPALAEELRDRVAAVVEAAQLGITLGSLDIEFVEVEVEVADRPSTAAAV